MKTMQKMIMVALLGAITLSTSAQQVTTMYFLENAPMRHTINPAFQPVSAGYINFSPLGWTSMGIGNNALTISDLIFVDPVTRKTITILHPDAAQQRAQLISRLPQMTAFNSDMQFSLLNFGFRLKENGYVMIGINQRVEIGSSLPKDITTNFLGGSIDFTNANFNLTGLGAGANTYTEISGGYSHRINEQWTVGGKLKVVLAQGYGMANFNQLSVTTSSDQWRIQGQFSADIAAPVNMAYLTQHVNGKSVQQVVEEINNGTIKTDSILNTKNIGSLLKPSGVGVGFDLGMTYKPIENLQISAAITDLGFVYWMNGSRIQCTVDTTFSGLGNVDTSDPTYQDANGNFSVGKMMEKLGTDLQGFVNAVKLGQATSFSGAKMLSARLNLGLDANFWDNRVGFGIVSATRLYNARLYEEVTLGVAFRPVNWFNIAASYSLLNNGKYSNIGAGISFMPYDGINMTLAMDYIPTSYAGLPNSKDPSAAPLYILPDKAKMVNVALGFSICWGSNHRDKDHDGVWDKLDMCPNTPRGVAVDEVGCPLDEDKDGVPDYLDKCPGTPLAAVGYVDSVGCMLDTDGDGVYDYMDKCPNTPEEAWGKVDSVGCPLDSDGDGVPDYIDECPGTPEAAYGKIDSKGCPLDSDGDGVPDYLDECPGTPYEALGQVDDKGCPIDTDGDGVPDYKDECPGTPEAAKGKVDARGCELDSDNDGVPDYLDECPQVAGLKENKGCPEVKREVRNLLKKAMQGIEFETGKTSIKKKSFPLLNQIAKLFIENTNYLIEVQGHTDNTGKYEVNKELSEKRANAVRDYLIEQGVDFQRLTAVGYGPDVPIADNSTKAGRAKNRRVEFKITFEEIHYESVLDHAEPAPAPAAESTQEAQ